MLRSTIIPLLVSCAVPSIASAQSQPAQPTPPSGPSVNEDQIQDIVVTAQKRTQSANSVGISITAISADTLFKLGISQPSDLAKLTPGFIFAQTQFATPVYSIRGIGFYETSIAATPAVTVYTDEVPLPYPQDTRFAGLDPDRVEILKGPQGTLFGQNSTGGAINYIAAKPAKVLGGGFDISYGRFNDVDASGFITGPITSTLSARLAVKTLQGSDWQRSYTRNDTRGQRNVLQGRLLLDWAPSDRFRSELSVNGWRDHSDTPGFQLVARSSSIPPLAAPAFLTYPLAPDDARAADWTPNTRKSRNDSLYQMSLRNDLDVGDALKLTTITAFTHLKIDAPVDADGTALVLYDLTSRGNSSSFFQEARIAGTFGGRGNWIVGANYSNDRSGEVNADRLSDSVTIHVLAPGLAMGELDFRSTDRARTIAAFANVEYPLTDTLTAQAGIRYTDLQRSFTGCTTTPPDEQPGGLTAYLEGFSNFIRSINGVAPAALSPGACVTLDTQTLTAGLVRLQLNEHNVPWRVGLNWKIAPNQLIYANVSKGFKAGTFATIGATFSSQFTPARQESVLAYEAGFKLSLADRHVQLNGAAFYYDYNDKQLRGSVIDAILGSLDKLVNVPKSHVVGGELQIVVSPVRGLRLTGGGTYVFSKVDNSFVNFTPYGTAVDFKGERFPYTPRWQGSLDVDYQIPLNAQFTATLGGNVQYQSGQTTAFGNLPLFRVPSYALLDLRAGVETADGNWRGQIWGRNVTNKFYYTSVAYAPSDATVRSAGRPATYGVSISHRF